MHQLLDGNDLAIAFMRGSYPHVHGSPDPMHPQTQQFWRDWITPFNRLGDWLLSFAPAGITAIEVTQDGQPLLLTATQYSGSVGVYDARNGKFLRRVGPAGWINDLIFAPWSGTPAK